MTWQAQASCCPRKKSPVALAGQTGGAIRVVLDFLFLLHQVAVAQHLIFVLKCSF